MLSFNLYRQERLWAESIMVEVCTQENEIISRVRLEECERNTRFMPSKARLKIFLKKYKIRALKFIVFALKLYTGASKSGVRGGPGPWASSPPLDPLVLILVLVTVGVNELLVDLGAPRVSPFTD